MAAYILVSIHRDSSTDMLLLLLLLLIRPAARQTECHVHRGSSDGRGRRAQAHDDRCYDPSTPATMSKQHCRMLYKSNDSFDTVECCFDIVAVFVNNVAGFGNNVERNFVLSTNSKQIEHAQFVSTLSKPVILLPKKRQQCRSNIRLCGKDEILR